MTMIEIKPGQTAKQRVLVKAYILLDRCNEEYRLYVGSKDRGNKEAELYHLGKVQAYQFAYDSICDLI